MTDVLGYERDRYYRHTGRVPMVGTTIAAVAAWAAVVALGIGYGYADLYIKVVDILSFLILAAFAAAMGFVVYGVLRWAQVRNMLVVTVVALTAGVLGWYASWVAWECAVIARATSAAPPMYDMAQQPAAIFDFARAINAEGTFTLRGRAVTGVELWLAWGIEALALIGTTAVVPVLALREQAFCETCRRWAKKQTAAVRLGHGDEDLMRQRVEAKDLDHLEKLGLADRDRPVHFRIDLFDCPGCDQTHLMSVSRVTVTWNNKNQRQESAKKLVDRLWLTAEEAEEVRSILQRLVAHVPPVGEVAPAVSPAPPET